MSNEKFDGIITISAAPGGSARLTLSGKGHTASTSIGEGHPGLVWIGSESAFASSTSEPGISLGTTVYHGAIFLNRNDGKQAIGLRADKAEITAGGAGSAGDVKVRDAQGNDVVLLNGGTGSSVVVLDSKKDRVLQLDDEGTGPVGMYLGVHISQGTSRPGVIAVRNKAGRTRSCWTARRGDSSSTPTGAHLKCPSKVVSLVKRAARSMSTAVSASRRSRWTERAATSSWLTPTAPRTSMSRTHGTSLLEPWSWSTMTASCDRATGSTDKRVVGVISGAGDCKPGLVLDKKRSELDQIARRLDGQGLLQGGCDSDTNCGGRPLDLVRSAWSRHESSGSCEGFWRRHRQGVTTTDDRV